jgi:hypothetical protein
MRVENWFVFDLCAVSDSRRNDGNGLGARRVKEERPKIEKPLRLFEAL